MSMPELLHIPVSARNNNKIIHDLASGKENGIISAHRQYQNVLSPQNLKSLDKTTHQKEEDNNNNTMGIMALNKRGGKKNSVGH